MTSLAYATLWIFVFTLPWENVVVIPGVGVISKLTGVVAAACTVIAAVIAGRVRRWHLLHVSAVLFVLYCAIEFLVFHSGEKLPNKFWTYLQLLLVMFLIWELGRTLSRQRGLLTAYVLGSYVAVLGTLLVFHRGAGAMRRFSLAGGDANDLAMTLALALPMAWYLGMTHTRPILRWICRGYLPAGLLAIGLTGSRGGMIATMVALLIVPLSMTKLTPGRLAASIAMLALAGALAVAYVPETIVERLASTGTEIQDARLGGRFKLWVAGVHAFARKPVFGWGTAGFKLAVTPDLGQWAQVAHNSYLSVLVEQGIIGFCFYMLMFVAVLRAIMELPKLERRFALVLFATLGVAMLPLTWEDRKPVWFILAALLGFARAWIAERGAPVAQATVHRAEPVPIASRSARPVGPLVARGRSPLRGPRR